MGPNYMLDMASMCTKLTGKPWPRCPTTGQPDMKATSNSCLRYSRCHLSVRMKIGQYRCNTKMSDMDYMKTNFRARSMLRWCSCFPKTSWNIPRTRRCHRLTCNTRPCHEQNLDTVRTHPLDMARRNMKDMALASSCNLALSDSSPAYNLNHW